MKITPVLIGLIAVSSQIVTVGAQTVAATPSPAIPMPPDKIDTYQFYSRLIPVGESANEGWPHGQFLVEDTTVQMVPSDKPCIPDHPNGKRDYTNMLNPHDAVTPPDGDREDYNEILADFDKHCHDRAQLDPSAWALSAPFRAPIHLLNKDQQGEFQRSRFGSNPNDPENKVLTEKYKGAPGLYTFSEVYFNARHTVALVYAGVWCGGLCGQWRWNTFRLIEGQWKPIRWNSTVTMS